MKKILLIGLDCAAPKLLFERFLEKLPNFSKMVQRGIYGELESCDPPITIPAWTVMTSSKSPGSLGIYGFRHRKENSYKDIWIASSRKVKTERIWDQFAKFGGKSCLIGVPPSYPPFQINGSLVGGFITPDTSRSYTYPEELKSEIKTLVGEYPVDVEFRIDDKKNLLKKIYEMTAKHFKVVKHLIKTRNWHFFMFVEIGLDRIHHAFWKYFDETHHLYEPGSEFKNEIEKYYRYLDGKIGELLRLIDKDTIVLIASDHGGKPMKGSFCINSWLMREGYLAIEKPIEEIIRFEDVQVNWSKTIAWGWGGYHARIFLNVKGREAKGVVEPSEYETIRKELADKITNIKGPKGEKWDTKVLFPEKIYSECKGDPPDMMIYLDNLSWRSAGTMGHADIYLPENDTGPDDAVHDKTGLYIYYDPTKDLGGKNESLNILDITPTLLSSVGLPIPSGLQGKAWNFR
jgi:predicted AlkP superfamily phosphohydrolase/phosphomutase